MYAVAEELELSFKATGNAVQVPDNEYGRLAYYLDCVSTCLPDLIEPGLTKYGEYRYFSESTKAQIVVYAALLTPALLEGKAFKKCTIAEMDALAPGYGNEFFQLTERSKLGVLGIDQDAAILIESKKVQVTKIMVYKQSWLEKNYIGPLERILSGRSAPAPKPRPQLTYSSNYKPPTNYQPSYQPSYKPSYKSEEEDESWNTLIRIFLCCMIFSILGVCCLGFCTSGKWTRTKVRAALLGFVFNLFIYIYAVNHGIIFASTTTTTTPTTSFLS